MDKKSYGNIGEALAYDYLKRNGYEIIKKNYKNKIGEIDIIAKQKDYFVFVEVKRRYTNLYGYGRESVNINKQRKIRLVALSYLKMIGQVDANCRFDVIELQDEKIEHLINCF